MADRPCNQFRRLPTYVITIHQRHRRTDRRTDGRTCMQSQYRAMQNSASRGKNAVRRVLAEGMSKKRAAGE